MRAVRIPIDVSAPLTVRETTFVVEYLVDLNGTKAATRAGYAPKSAHVTASKLLCQANVQAAIHLAIDQRSRVTMVEASRVLRDIDSAANLDVALLVDGIGRLRPVHELPIEVRRAIVSIEVVTKRTGKHVERVHKVKLIDKGKMQELLAKHTGLLIGDGASLVPPGPAFVLPADTPGINVH